MERRNTGVDRRCIADAIEAIRLESQLMLISVSQLRIDSIDQSPLIFFQSKTPLLFPFPPPSLFARKWRIDSYFQESVQTPPTGWNRRRRRRIKKRGRHKILQIFITTVEFSPSQVARIRMGVLCIIELNLRLPSWFPPSLPSRLPLSLSLSFILFGIHHSLIPNASFE